MGNVCIDSKGVRDRARLAAITAYSKGFSELGSEEADGTCVYPRGMIHETEIKSRGKWVVVSLRLRVNPALSECPQQPPFARVAKHFDSLRRLSGRPFH